MPKDYQHIVFLNNYFNSLPNPDILTEPTKQTAIRCNAAHIPPTTPGVDGVDSQIVGRHISECRRRARNQPRAERNKAWQVDILEAAYRQNHYPSAGERMILMYRTDLSYRKIKNWFEQKAKMLKKAGGGPVGPNPGSNKYSTKMWKAYFADPVGYVQKLMNGEIDMVTGAAIGQAVNNLVNAPASDPINNTGENPNLGTLAPGTTIVPGPDYQSGHQHNQGGCPDMQPQPYNHLSQYEQYDYSNVQAPPQSPVPRQAQYGPQSMPIYTQAQDSKSMNSGISSYAAGRSYQVSAVQPAPRQTAQPGAYIANTMSQDVVPELLDRINQAVPDQYNYGMPPNYQSGITQDEFPDQDDGELQDQDQWQGKYEPFYPPVTQLHAERYMRAYPQALESRAGQSFDENFPQSNGPARKRKSIPDDDELNQGPYAAHLRKRPRQVSDSQFSTSSESRMLAGVEGKMRVTREPAKRLRASRPVQKTRRRPIAGQSQSRRTSGNGTDDSMNSSFDHSGLRWSPPPPSRLNISHSSPYEGEIVEVGATSPNIRTPNIRTPDVRGSDFEAQPLDPLLFRSEQSGPNNSFEDSSGQSFVAFEPLMQESLGDMTQSVTHPQQHAAANIPDPAAQQYDAAPNSRAPSPTVNNRSGSLDGNWETDLEVQGHQPQQDSTFPQGEAQDFESFSQIAPVYAPNVQDIENFEDVLPVPYINALEQAFLHNGEFDYSAFLGNDGLFEDWDPPNLDGNN
ncbi:putative transcription factor sequence protein [Botrytis fragariae]|uniref:Putative transcription factor sequence protein n=1 Tax=Botrytis fragariae TaxID=1964551 RepID=A0A8H6B3P4_9HELO|nr:putative transcription factor sequence protein [Botrytis fragariae]KAF5878605.1 putative transcription factor sequence protein [Botrytis fragariae]